MMAVSATYFDGIQATGKHVSLEYVNQNLLVKTFDGQLMHRFHAQEYHIQPSIGRSKRIIDLPMAAHLSLTQDDFLALFPAKQHSGFWSLLHGFENHLGLVGIIFIGVIVASLAFVRWGVPIIAYTTANLTPLTIETKLGQQALDALDESKLGYFKPSERSLSEQAQITQQLISLCQKTNNCPAYTLHFRRSHPNIGANAFALPGGHLVLTDDLIALAKDPNEITAVLAHELGHVQKRHALRQILQSSISGLLIVTLTGDFSSLAAGIPTAMLHLQYTRDLEIEADRYALDSMIKACIPSHSFADILTRLDKQSKQGNSIPEFLSSHPATQKRIQPFLEQDVTCL